jgi:hypothetical protein
MSENIISPSDAGLLIHRFVTEAIPVVTFYTSADHLLKLKIRGFITSFTKDIGLTLSTESPAIKPETTLPAYVMFSHNAIATSTFEYSDETEVPEDFELTSGLRINLPNGDTLIIAERRVKAI